MKTNSNIVRALVLVAIAAFLFTQAQAATVLSDQFTSATINGTGTAAYVSSATNWFSFQSNAGGVPVVIGTGTPSPITGNALSFSGSSANDIVVCGFNPVTLSLAGQYIQVSLNYAYYTTLPTAGTAALLGLFSNNGTAVTANGFANRTELLGAKGYKVEKLITATGTSDLSVYGITEGGTGSSYFGGGTALTTNSTGVTSALATAYTMTLRLTLAPNGTSLLLDSSFGGISTAQQTIASPLTLTFNEMAFRGTGGGGGKTYMDNVLVTIPAATWVGNVSADLSGANWNTNPPTSGDSWIFGVAGTGGAALTNGLTAVMNVAGITFNATGSAYTIGGNAITLTGDIKSNYVGTETLNFNIATTTVCTVTTSTNCTLVLGGNISGTGGLSANGTGTLTLSGTNTYTGNTTVSVGTLLINGSTNAGSSVAVNGGTLGGNGTVGGTTGVTGGAVNGTGLALAGLTTFNGTGNTLSGTVTSTSGVTLSSSAALALNGVLTGGLAVGNGTLTGTGGSVSGATTLNGGTINLTSGTLGSLGVTGGNWNGNGTVTGAATSSSGTFTIGSGANLTANGGLAVTGGTIAAGNSTSTITGSVNYTSSNSSSFGGVIAGSGKTLTMNATGATLTLSGNNTYTGTTNVTGGTLLANNTSGSATGSGNVTVASGATLGGNGTIGGATTVQSGGTLSPGNSPGVETFTSGLTLETGSVFTWQLTSNSTGGRGTSFDGVDVTGGTLIVGAGVTFNAIFNLTGSTVDFNDAFWKNNQSWLVFDNANAPAMQSGIFTMGTVSSDSFGNSLSGNLSFSRMGNDIYLDFSFMPPVPEPSTWVAMAALVLTGGTIVLRRRRSDHSPHAGRALHKKNNRKYFLSKQCRNNNFAIQLS